MVNGEPVPMYQAVLVHAGDELSIGITNGNGKEGLSCVCRRA